MTGINICFVKDYGAILKLWTRKTIECSEFGELFCGISKDQNVESNADEGGLDYEIQRPFKTLLELKYLGITICVSSQTGLTN